MIVQSASIDMVVSFSLIFASNPMIITLTVSCLVFLLTSACALYIQRKKQSNQLLLGVQFILFTLAMIALLLLAYIVYYTFVLSVSDQTRQLNPSMHYERELIQHNQRPAVIHTAKIKLSDVVFSVTAPKHGEQKYYHLAQTTTDALKSSDADLAINASFFYPFREKHLLDYYPHNGDIVYPVGTAIHDGVSYGNNGADWPSFVIFKNGRVAIKRIEQQRTNGIDSVQYAISGKQYLIKDGVVAIREETKPYPRAVLGMDKTKTHLWLVVVDGKQYHYSMGLGLLALSQRLIQQGIHNAIELDGGGSATLAYKNQAGQVEVLSRPIHTHIPNRERPVANHLLIKRLIN